MYMKFVQCFFKISPCNHGMSFLKRLRSTVGGNQRFYVPIAPKPVATVVPASTKVATLPSITAVSSVATPTNYQLSASSDLETDSTTWTRSQPALDLSSSLISVAQAKSTPENQNSSNLVTQMPLLSTVGSILSIPPVSPVQGPSSVSETATRPVVLNSDNTVAQNQLPASSIVNQSASIPAIHDSVGTNSLLQPSRRSNSLVDMIPEEQLPTSAIISQTASRTPVNGSFDILSQRQLATLVTNPLPTPSQLFNSSVNMAPQGQPPASPTVSYIAPVNGSFNILPQQQVAFNNSVNMVPRKEVATSATVSQLVQRSLQPFVCENTASESQQIPGSVGFSDQSVAQSLLNAGSQLVNQPSYASSNTEQELRKFKAILETYKAAETGSQEANEAIHGLHSSNIAASAVLVHASSRIAQSPGLNLLADVGEAQRVQYEHNIANRENIQVIVCIK